jgi:predicted glycosyltransferase
MEYTEDRFRPEEFLDREDRRMTQPLRFLLYSHDGLGLGHMRRNLAIAEAIVSMAPHSAILLATGASHTAQFGLPRNVDYLKLPEIRKVHNERYASRRLGISGHEIGALRSTLLQAAVESFRPDVLLADKHPLGVSGELRPALKTLRENGGCAALGLRDILDSRESVMKEWFGHRFYERVLENYDQVLIYGQESVFDAIHEYSFPVELAERAKYCGYVVNRSEQSLTTDSGLARLLRDGREKPLILATAGGGEDGFILLETFVRASAGAPWQGVIVAGPMMSESEQAVLHRMCAEAGVFFEPFVSRLEAFVGSFDALVCMGGYNTLMEAMVVGTPTLCAPRSAPRLEQWLRAKGFRDLGLLEMIEADELNVETLRAGIGAQINVLRSDLNARVRAVLNFEGAYHAASALLSMASASRFENRHVGATAA